MLVNVYCYNYNNYYNRIIKKKDNIIDYGDYSYLELGVNFNFSDGVDTAQVLNTNLNPDYIVVTNENNEIHSRWFVIDSNYQRNGQHIFTLHRDVIADNLDAVLSADTFIEKAILPNDNKLIYNNENMSFNQIKTSETFIKDDTNAAWIVGYLGKDYAGGQIDFEANNVADMTMAQFGYKNLAGSLIRYESNYNKLHRGLQFNVVVNSLNYYVVKYYPEENRYRYTADNSILSSPNGYYNIGITTSPINLFMNRLTEYFNYIIPDYINTADCITDPSTYDNDAYLDIVVAENKVIVEDNDYYKLSETRNNNVKKYYNASVRYTNDIIGDLNAFCTLEGVTGTSVNFKPIVFTTTDTVIFTLNEQPAGSYTVTIPGPNDRYHLKDAPYDMFIMPYADNYSIKSTGSQSFSQVAVSKDLTLSLAQGMARQIGDFLIDLQLLPYCPITGYTMNDLRTVMDIKANNAKRYTMIKLVKTGSQVNICPMIWSLASSGSIRVDIPIEVDNKKLVNECDMWRLVSPNYNGQFEFNAAKNDGVDSFDIDFTYIPYQPYIHINPVFNNGSLYGQEYNDCRGLICGGDFSISYLNNKWVDYKNNNKNFQEIFDRQISHIEYNNNWQLAGDILNATTSSAQGAVSGATMGAAGGPIGMIAGAAIGGTISAIGGAADVISGASIRAEALDYTKDLFGYQLGNIKAMPDSLAKVSSRNVNNKIFPILEYYTCSNEEKKALANKIAFNGMTVMTIGKIAEYAYNNWEATIGDDTITSKNYIKGKLIRINLQNEDFHLINTIANELNKGVYLQWD